MSTSETALTGHLVMPDGHPGDAFLMQAAVQLRERYRIGHVDLAGRDRARHDLRAGADEVV